MLDEAHQLRHTLRSHHPGDPFGPTEGFSKGAIRLARIGYTSLELAQEIGHSSAMSQLRWVMMLLRKEKQNPRHMRRGGEYEEAHACYVSRIRDFRQEPERMVRLPTDPPRTYSGRARIGDGVPLNPIDPSNLPAIDVIRKNDVWPNQNSKGRKYVYGPANAPEHSVIEIPILLSGHITYISDIHLRNGKGKIGFPHYSEFPNRRCGD